MLDDYEPSMQSPDDADGGRCLEWYEAEPLLAKLLQAEQTTFDLLKEKDFLLEIWRNSYGYRQDS